MLCSITKICKYKVMKILYSFNLILVTVSYQILIFYPFRFAM